MTMYKNPFYTVQIVNSTDIDEISLPLNYNINFYNECFINENRNVINNTKRSLDKSDNIKSLQKLKIVIPESIEYSEDLVKEILNSKTFEKILKENTIKKKFYVKNRLINFLI